VRLPAFLPVTAALVAGATFALTGCTSLPSACSAVGWSNSLTVELEGDTSGVSQVQLCTEDGCAPARDIDPSGPLGQISVARQAGGTWSFSTGMTNLDALTVRTIAADGAVISETEVTPEWVRVGGSEQCGGPGKATVRVEI